MLMCSCELMLSFLGFFLDISTLMWLRHVSGISFDSPTEQLLGHRKTQMADFVEKALRLFLCEAELT